MNHRRTTSEATIAATLFLSACAPAIDFGRAVTLAPGEVRPFVGADTSLITAYMLPEQPVHLPWATVTGGVHAGVSDMAEFGARAWASGWPGYFTTVGVAGETKRTLYRSTQPRRPNVAGGLAVAWHRAALGGQPWHVLSMTAPLLVGAKLGNTEVTLGPRVAAYAVTSYGQRALWTTATGAGVAWHIPIHQVELSPQLVWMSSPVPWDGTSGRPERRGAQALQATLTVAWSMPGTKAHPAQR